MGKWQKPAFAIPQNHTPSRSCSNLCAMLSQIQSTLSKVAACFKAAEGQALPMTNVCGGECECMHLCVPSTWRTEAGRRLPVTFQFMRQLLRVSAAH